MPKISYSRIPKIWLTAIFSVATIASSQTVPNVQQKSDKSTCSNILALTGNININCSSLTPAQKKALESIPKVLRMAMTNQDYLNAIMVKLDEMSKNQGTSIVQNCPSGICNNGPNSGSQTVINNGPAERHLTPLQISQLGEFAKSLPTGMGLTLRSGNEADANQYANEIKTALSGRLTSDYLIEMISAAKGTFVLISGPDSKAFPYAQQLAGILGSTGTKITFATAPERVGPGGILIYIGAP